MKITACTVYCRLIKLVSTTVFNCEATPTNETDYSYHLIWSLYYATSYLQPQGWTHRHTYTCRGQNQFQKPCVLATGSQAWFERFNLQACVMLELSPVQIQLSCELNTASEPNLYNYLQDWVHINAKPVIKNKYSRYY